MRTAFGQRRKMLRRSLAGVVTAEQFVAAGVAETARPEELGLDDWVRLTHGGRRDGDVRRGPRAPAKLTLSLRITGVRADGYHLLDAEMVTLDLADTLTFTPGGDGITVGGPYAAGVPTDGIEPRRQGAGRRRPHGPPCTSTSGSPTVAGWAGARPTPPPCCAGPVATTSTRRPGSAPTCRSASSAGGPACRASARSSSRCRSSR